MVILINPYAAGGNALKKWRSIRSRFVQSGEEFSEHVLEPGDSIGGILAQFLQRGEDSFVAAGGDGTVNTVLNALMNTVPPTDLSSIRLGAIGLGSSNDFHKPWAADRFPQGIPLKIDWTHATPRDIGTLTFENDGGVYRRYFLMSASLGVTAEANELFNHPDPMLNILKRSHTRASIYCAALRTIVTHRNIPVTLSRGNGGTVHTLLSNLAVLKSPYVAGDLHYDSCVSTDDGRFGVYLHSAMSRGELVSLLWNLSGNAGTISSKTFVFELSTLSVSSEQIFTVEFDGETIRTKEVRFGLLPRLLRVCQ